MKCQDSPSMERIVLQDLDDSDDDVRLFPENPKYVFRTLSEDAFDACHSETIDHISREPERDAFRNA